MKKRYFLLAGIMILFGVVLLFMPEKQNTEQVSPDQLMGELNEQTRFIGTDEVAERIINKDPSIMLVDVRSMYDYTDFSLPGAVNIPLEEILLEDWKDYVDQDVRSVIFFSNGTIDAEKAWILTRRLGYTNNYIMKGGLNCWIDDIIKPTKPPVTASSEEFDRYQFRLGASRFFGGGNLDVQTESGAEPIQITRKTKTQVVEGGC